MIFCNCNKVFVLYQNITQDGHIILHEMMHVTLNVDVILCVVIDECNVDRCMFYCLYSDNLQILHILTIFYILQGHRYEAKHKAFALVLYKTMGKRAYTCLRNIFQHIPSIQTLQLALHKIPMSPGINSLILRHLENIAPNMSIKDKVCILIWDEVSIQPKLTYDTRKDIICGFEDWGNNRTSKAADHVLVFMLRGLNSGWKMPVSYNFCYKQTNTAQLMYCIKDDIKKINNAGFHIVATVCDQGSSNVAAIKELLLRSDMKRNFEKRPQSK